MPTLKVKKIVEKSNEKKNEKNEKKIIEKISNFQQGHSVKMNDKNKLKLKLINKKDTRTTEMEQSTNILLSDSDSEYVEEEVDVCCLKEEITLNHTNISLTSGTYLEEINANKLFALTKSNNLSKNKIWEDDWMGGGKKFCKMLLENLRFINNKYYLPVVYCGARDESNADIAKKKYIGRVYPKKAHSLGSMPRAIRHFLCNDLYYDIDIANCHPNIARCLCEHWEIDAPYLSQYCYNRETIIKKIMTTSKLTKDESKTFVITIMNGGKIETFRRNHKIKNIPPFIFKFKKEIENITGQLKKKKGDRMYNELTKHKTVNKNGTFMAMILQMYEVQMLFVAVELAKKKKIITNSESKVVLAHDGLMLLKSSFKENYTFENYIKELNLLINEQLGLVDCHFINKPMNEYKEIENLLKKENIDWNEKYIDTYYEKYNIRRNDVVKVNDDDLTNLFYTKQKNKYVYCNKDLYFLKNDGLYKNMTDKTFRNEYSDYMKEFIDNCEKQNFEYENSIHQQYQSDIAIIEAEWHKQNNKKPKKYRKKKPPFDSELLDKYMDKIERAKDAITAGAVSAIKMERTKTNHIQRLYQKYSNDDFEDILDTDKNLLGFENGLLDLTTMEFRPAKEGEYVCMSVGYSWIVDVENTDSIDENLKKCVPRKEIRDKADELYKKLNECFRTKDDFDCCLRNFSRCLKGVNKEEIMMFLKGKGANGKSIIFLLLHKCLGEYCYDLSYKKFVHERKDNHDPELNGAKKVKCILISEPNAKYEMNSDFFKRFTGGDGITTRTHHEKKTTTWVPPPSFIAANPYVKMDSDTQGNSMQRRIQAYEFPYQFYTKDRMHQYDASNKYHKIGDETIKQEINSGFYNEAFMWLLIKAYIEYKKSGLNLTKNIKQDSKAYFDKISDGITWFRENLEKDKRFNISTKSLLLRYNEDNNVNWSATVFNKKLREYYSEDSVKKTTGYQVYDFVQDGVRKDATKCKCSALLGYRFKVESNEDSEEEESDEESDEPFMTISSF